MKTCTLGVKKPRKSDMDRFNPCGNQATHFASWMENSNVANFACNHKKVGTTSKTRSTICLSLMSERKPQVRQVVVARWSAQKCVKMEKLPLKT